MLEQPLEKKSGVRFGPPGSRRMVYFLDDLNMPFVDKYDTQSAIELARQFVDTKDGQLFHKESQGALYAALLGMTRSRLS